MSWFNRSVATIAVLGVLGTAVLGYVNHQVAGALVEARAQVQDARQEVKTANVEAARALAFAHAAQVAKDSAEAKARTHAGKGDYQSAYEEQKRATASLQAAVDTLVPALEASRAASTKLDHSSDRLVHASGDSFLKRLIPDLGVGGAVGVNPAGKPDAVIGLTLSWRV